MIGDFLSGAGYFFRGFNLVKRPGLRRFILIPFIINVLVFTGAIWFGIHRFDNLISWLLPGGESWWAEFARVVMWIFFALTALVVLFFAFTLVANLIGAPFNGLLSEKVERHLIGDAREDSGTLKDFALTIIPSLISELRKLIYFILLAVMVFILSLVPVINLISPLLWALFTSWMLAVEYIAYPMENHDMYFSQVKAELRRKRGFALGFGVAAMAASLIPVVNFLVMPAAVAGATALWVEILKEKGIPAR